MTAYQGLESMPRVKIPRCYNLALAKWGEEPGPTKCPQNTEFPLKEVEGAAS